jgi:thioredoxin 1
MDVPLKNRTQTAKTRKTMASANILNLDDNNFDSQINKGATPVLVDFWAPWCGPCRMIAPVLDKIADATAGKAVVAKVNVDEAPGVASRFRVSSIPTLLFFKNGEVQGQVVGLQSEADLTARLNALM